MVSSLVIPEEFRWKSRSLGSISAFKRENNYFLEFRFRQKKCKLIQARRTLTYWPRSSTVVFLFKIVAVPRYKKSSHYHLIFTLFFSFPLYESFVSSHFISPHPCLTPCLFQSVSAVAAFPWPRVLQRVCGRWRSARHPRPSSSADKTRIRPWVLSPPALSPPRVSVAPVPEAGRPTATWDTATRFVVYVSVCWRQQGCPKIGWPILSPLPVTVNSSITHEHVMNDKAPSH